MSSRIVKEKSKMSNTNKVDNQTVVEKIVKKVTRKISDKASAYSRYSKGSSFGPTKFILSLTQKHDYTQKSKRLV